MLSNLFIYFPFNNSSLSVNLYPVVSASLSFHFMLAVDFLCFFILISQKGRTKKN